MKSAYMNNNKFNKNINKEYNMKKIIFMKKQFFPLYRKFLFSVSREKKTKKGFLWKLRFIISTQQKSYYARIKCLH